jgi:uncharacterized membrane protein
MNRRECKETAKKIMKDQWIVGFVVLLIESLIVSALSTMTLGIGLFLLQSIIIIAVYNVFINGYAGKKYEVSDMLNGITDEITNRICLSVLKQLYTFLWTLLFIIPGIVKSYSYFLAEFISRKDPKLSATDCITKSREIMDGHKWELFVFQLSFIGWHLLAILTFGILYIWLAPYIMQSTIVYIDKNIYKLIDDAKVEDNNEFVEAKFVDAEVL